MLLAIDVGNTNIVFGVYDGEHLMAHWRVSTHASYMCDEYAMLLSGLLTHRQLSFADIKGVALATVVPPLLTIFREVCEQYLNLEPLVVGPGIRTGMKIWYDSPRDVGADRIVNAVAAHKLYGGPAIIVDFGTATTFDAISPEGDYLGGAIAPGVRIATEALFSRTSRLPRIELVAPSSAIGKNTVAAMQSGIVLGYVGLVEGMVRRFKREMGGSPKVIATGGLAEIVSRESNVVDIVDGDLTLTGLRLIYEMNSTAEGKRE